MSAPIVSQYIAQGGAKVVYHAPASDKYGLWVKLYSCLSGNWLAPCSEIKDRTYVTLYENRIEYSSPVPACCCCMCDVTSTVYLDRPIAANAEKVGCCTPAFTHCSFCPTCFDWCGEGVIIYGADCCTDRRVLEPGVGSCIPCRGFMLMCGIDNAEQLARAIDAARETCKNRAHGVNVQAMAAPMQQAMVPTPPVYDQQPPAHAASAYPANVVVPSKADDQDMYGAK